MANTVQLTHTGAQLDAAITKVENDYADVSGTTAIADDVAQGKYFVTSAGVLTAGTSQGGGGFSITGNITNGTLTGATVTYPDSTGVESVAVVTIVPTANPLHALPSSVTVTNATSVYDQSTGEITITNATDDIVITANCPRKYMISGTITNGSLTSDGYILENETTTVYISADQGYKAPTSLENIVVTNATKVSINSGVLTISNPTGDVTITATCEQGWLPYLTFSSPNAFTLKLHNANNQKWEGTLEYSTDATTWATFHYYDTISSANNVLYLRGTGNTRIQDGNQPFNSGYFEFTGSDISCNGNIETLLDYQTVMLENHPTMRDYAFAYLFNEAPIISAPALEATTLNDYCYTGMLYGCTGLTSAPNLPATVMAPHCYDSMLRGCSNITTFQSSLWGNTLAEGCYAFMYHSTGITFVDSIPAITLVLSCFYCMFVRCADLQTPPSFSASIQLADNCFNSMFSGSGITSLPELPFKNLTNKCYNEMFYGCSNIKLSTAQVDDYVNEYSIPPTKDGVAATNSLASMFSNTGGTFTGTPTINTSYYTSNAIVPAT